MHTVQYSVCYSFLSRYVSYFDPKTLTCRVQIRTAYFTNQLYFRKVNKTEKADRRDIIIDNNIINNINNILAVDGSFNKYTLKAGRVV